MKRERNYHFDNMKALLIFLVVFGHMISKFAVGSVGDTLYDIIFSFHMPAFIFVSGYFAGLNTKRSLSKLVPLYLVFQFLQILERKLIVYAATGSFSESPRFQLFKPEWTLWYLMALIFFQLLLPVFETDIIRHQVYYVIFAAVLGILIGLNPDTDNFMAMSRIFVFLPFYLLGYYENKNRILERFWRDQVQKQARTLSAVLGVLLIILFIKFEPYISTSDFYGKKGYSDVYDLIGRLIGWFCALVWISVLLIWIPKKRVPILDTVGKNTLPVYLLHSLVILILVQTPLKGVIGSNLFGLLLVSVVLTLLLSREVFEKALRKIAIPITKKE